MSQVTESDFHNYYSNFFPLSDISQWISYNGQVPLDRRECTFVIGEDEGFLRYSRLDNFSAGKYPTLRRIEIGPVYSHPMHERSTLQSGEFQPIEHELVFDIDMGDFDEVRTCCTGTNICPKCWNFMSGSLHFLIRALKENFGFKSILPVFSGRRGVHIWVCDEKARKLNQQCRRSIVNYLNLIDISSKNVKCPLLEELWNDIHTHFINNILTSQQTLTDKKIIKRISDRISKIAPNMLEDFNNAVSQAKRSGMDPKELWNKYLVPHSSKPLYRQIVIDLTYPRLDVNVTTIMNHLLKTPFSIHPGSGLLSLPIPQDKIDIFPPEWVPDIHDLLKGDEKANQIFEAAIRQFQNFKDETIK